MSNSPAIPAPFVPVSYKSLEDLVSLMAGVASAVIAAPKPLTLSSLSELLPLLPQIELVVSELGDLPKEIGEMSFSEGTNLVGIIAAKLSVADAKAVAIINASLQLVAASMSLVSAIKG